MFCVMLKLLYSNIFYTYIYKIATYIRRTNSRCETYDIAIVLCKYTAPTPRIFSRPAYPQHGIISEVYELVCLITLSSTAQSSSVNLTWDITSNDDRVTVTPTTITTDDSIGIIYTTVIQFVYLIEEDEGNYTCAVTIDEDSAESTFNLELVGK